MSGQIYRTLATLITIVYLLGTSLATAWYFSDGFKSGLFSPITIIAALLALAVEGHNWLQQRTSWSSFKAWMKAVKTQEVNANELRLVFLMNAGVTFVLVCVLAFFSLMFNSETFHPFGQLLSPQAQQIVKGLILPFLYLMTIFMVEIEENLAAMTQRFSQRLYRRSLQTAHKQFAKRFQAIERSNKNAAPIAIGLANYLGDTQSAGGTEVIDRMLALVEGQDTTPIDNGYTASDDDEPVEMNHHELAPVAYFELGDVEKQVMVLHYNHGMSQSQIALRLGISQSSVSGMLRGRIDTWRQLHGYPIDSPAVAV